MEDRTRIALAFVVCGFSALVFGVLGATVALRGGFAWDGTILNWLRPRRPMPSASTTSSILDVGTIVGPALLAGSLVVLVASRRFRPALFLGSAVAGAVALEVLLKAAFKRPAINPGDHGYSFPSGSALVSAAAVAALILLARSRRGRRIATASGAALLILVGIMIVSARWHYPSDVIAGWMVAIAWVTAAWLLSRWAHSRTRGRPFIRRRCPDRRRT